MKSVCWVPLVYIILIKKGRRKTYSCNFFWSAEINVCILLLICRNKRLYPFVLATEKRKKTPKKNLLYSSGSDELLASIIIVIISMKPLLLPFIFNIVNLLCSNDRKLAMPPDFQPIQLKVHKKVLLILCISCPKAAFFCYCESVVLLTKTETKFSIV
jgi:hypothetical protein